MDVLIIIFSALILISAGIGVYVVQVSIHPKRKEYNFTRENEIAKGYFTNEYDETLEKEEFYLESKDGYKLHCMWVPNPKGATNKAVIIAHGYTYTLYGSYKYMTMFHDLGYDVMLYDERYHGKSGGSNSTFGYKESIDLETVTDEVFKRVGENGIVGTHGESLGGSTVLLHGVRDKRLSFVIADCAYMDMTYQLGNRMKEDNHLPKYPIIWFASLFNKIVTGGFYKDASPIRVMDKMTRPTMIIHGMEDDFTSYDQGEKIYAKLKCKKKFYGVKGAKHALSYMTDSETYKEQVKAFLQDVIGE